MDKVEFITRIEAAKKNLPISVVPLFLTKYPEYNTYKKKSRVANVVQGKVRDEKILEKLEELAEILKPSN